MARETQPPVSSSASSDARLQALEEKVTRLVERVEQLEHRHSELPALPKAWPLDSQLESPSARAAMSRWVTFLGRSCVVLGGAFLVRALTDARILPGGLGAALGILFAATWLLFSHRAAAVGEPVSAGFHGVVAALIAYPLVLESTTRLGVMSTLAAAMTLVGFTALLLTVSRRDPMGWLAWVGVVACLLTTFVLLRATEARAEFIGVLLILATATYFWPGDRSWRRGLPWAPAVILDLVILRTVLGVSPPALFFPLTLAVLSLGLVLSRTAGSRPVGVFEVFQTVTGLVIGLAGALRIAREMGHGEGAVAAGVVAASLVTTFFAARVVPRRGNREQDFLFYAALSLALLSFGAALLATGGWRGALWSLLALVAVLLGRRRHPVSLWSLAALLAMGAAFSSGLSSEIWQAVAGRQAIHWVSMAPGSIVVLGLVVLGYVGTVPSPRPAPSSPTSWASARVPAAVLLLLGAAGVAGLILKTSHAFTVDLARLAGARIVVAVVAAFSLALIRRRVARPELTWVAFLALALGGVELVFVELPSGRPLTLLVSFVVYGAGLILVPRLASPGRDLLSSSRPR